MIQALFTFATLPEFSNPLGDGGFHSEQVSSLSFHGGLITNRLNITLLWLNQLDKHALPLHTIALAPVFPFVRLL